MYRHAPFIAATAFCVLVGSAQARQAPQGGWTHDYTEAPSSQTQSDYYVVVFGDPAAASYTGGISGLKPTKPAWGKKLNPRAPDVLAYVSYLKSIHESYVRYLASTQPRAQVVREAFLVGNALAVKANGASADTLRRGPGVRYVSASWVYRPTMTVSNELIGADILWAPAGGRANAGSGIDIGIVDTGIRDDHAAFGCKSGITHKVYASGFNPPPFDLSQIVFTHGTHVAGTAAGCVLDLSGPEDGPTSGTWSGVAPGANLHDYNVFPGFGGGFIAFDGSAFSHDICAAVEDGIADGMDVLNLSIGGGVQGPRDFLAECIDGANDAGVVVAVAAGIVTWSRERYGYGKMVEINHGDGFVTRYAHNERNLVSVGDTVQKGQAIALMGSTGRATGPNLHFEVLRNGRQVDPLKFIGNGRRPS